MVKESKEWSDRTILKSILNTCKNHNHILETTELTFHGFPNQPDYAKLTIEVRPDDKAVELKSFKDYLFQFRTKHISYERLLNTIFDDFIFVYKPLYLKIKLETNSRGGIKSMLEKEAIKRKKI